MGRTGNPAIRRLKRLARGESTAVVMGMAGGILLAAVMWRGTAPHREAAAAPRVDLPESSDQAGAPGDRGALLIADAELAETAAELESLPDAVTPPRDAVPPEAVSAPDVEVSDRNPPMDRRPSRPAPIVPVRNEPTGEATLAFWDAVNDVISREAAMRIAPANLTAANAGGFVDARVRAGRFAGDALRKLPRENVDREVIAHSVELATWYDEEARLAGEASSLLGSTDFAARRGSAGKSWRSSEDRHRQRCDEINRRSVTLQAQLSQKYGRPFPALQ